MTTPSGVAFQFICYITGQVVLQVNGGSGGSYYQLSPSSMCDGNVHQFVGVVNPSGNTVAFYVDGAQVDAAGTMSGTLGTGPKGAAYMGLVDYAYPFSGAYAYFAVYPAALSAARIQTHYNAGANGCSGDTTIGRITRLLSYRTNNGSRLTTCSGTMGAQITQGDSMQDALIQCGDTEGSMTYINGSGQVALIPRQATYATTAAVTLDVSQSQMDAASTFTIDAQYLTNQVMLTRVAGSTQQVENTTSETKYGIRSRSVTMSLASDSDALNAATWIVLQEATPSPRTTQVTVDLLTESSNTQVTALLGVTPLALLTITNLPSTAPASSMSLLIQGWSEVLGLTQWDMAFNCSDSPSPGVLMVGTGTEANSQLDTSSYVLGW